VDAIFSGGNTNGLLTAGTLRIAGSFTQVGTNSAQSFAASPGHLTVLSANPASITFTTPGGSGLSHFGNLSESGFGATFNLNSDVTVLGGISGGDGFGGTMVGTSCPTTLTTTGWNTSGSPTLNCVRLVINDPGATVTGMGGVSFINLPTTTTQLTIRHPGFAAGNFFTNFLVFLPLTTGNTGFYIRVEDTDAAAPFLSVSPSGTNVTNGPSFTNPVGGGTVIWP
jgi:hypothetical protein